MIDLRSDTVTEPTDEMRSAMASAEVGDDVYGEDPSVNALESEAADRLGMAAAVMVPSGTQGNLVALLTHCDRGEEFLVGEPYHTYAREGGGASVLGGIKPEPLEVRDDGTIPVPRIRNAVKPAEDPHSAQTTLLSLEAPTAGRVPPLAYLERACGAADESGLAKHLDGARLFNAATALNRPARDLAAPFDSVMFALSKGLGAPVGSILCGSEPFVRRARRWRKVVGGGWRQAGLLAAAGSYALEHHVERLEEDHRRARLLAEGLEDVPGVAVDPESVEINMVFARLERGDVESLAEFLASRDILIHPLSPLRLVTHLGVDRGDIERSLAAFEEYFA